MNNMLYTSEARGKYILKNYFIAKKNTPSHEYTHLSQPPEVENDNFLLTVGS